MEYWDRRQGKNRKERIVLKDGKIKNLDYSYIKGRSVRVLKNGRWALSSDSNPSLENTASLLKDVKEGKRTIRESKAYSGNFKGDVKINPFDVDKKEKIKFLKDLYRSVEDRSGKIRSMTIKSVNSTSKLNIKNSFRSDITKRGTQTAIALVVTVKSGGNIQRAFWHRGKKAGYELIENLDREEIAEEVVSKALKLLKADPAPPGHYPIILDPELAGVFFHEAIGHACEADLHVEGSSVLEGKLGQKIADEKVTLVDDPMIPSSRGSIYFDDEGEKAKKTTMIKDGVLTRLLHSRETASRMNKKTTGNGRSSSYSNFQIPRMTNTVLKEGDYSLEEAIEGIDKGFFLKGSSGGQVETTKGEFLFNAEIGYRIEDGEIKEPIRDVSLVGNILRILRKVNAVGKERKTAFRWGWCGKKGQMVPVDESCPFIRVKEAVLGGRK